MELVPSRQHRRLQPTLSIRILVVDGSTIQPTVVEHAEMDSMLWQHPHIRAFGENCVCNAEDVLLVEPVAVGEATLHHRIYQFTVPWAPKEIQPTPEETTPYTDALNMHIKYVVSHGS
jgi:hypothetical protein